MNHARRGVLNQFDLGNVLRNLFPGHYVISNARNYGELVQAENGPNLELDYWIPELKLAFEFQDPHHYVASLHSHEPLQNTMLKDKMKTEILASRGETLIAVPCWWDGEEKSLVHTIRATRPELLVDWRDSWNERAPDQVLLSEPKGEAGQGGGGIPLVPPDRFFEEGIPDIGYLQQPVFANSASDLRGWWIGEKYDGIRICWHFEKKQLYLRSSKVLPLPEVFLRDFPSIYLDGEIWFGRGSFFEPQTLLINPRAALYDPNQHHHSKEVAQPHMWFAMRVIGFDNVSKAINAPSNTSGIINAINAIDTINSNLGNDDNHNSSGSRNSPSPSPSPSPSTLYAGHGEAGSYESRFHLLLDAVTQDHPVIGLTAVHKCLSTEYIHKVLKDLLTEGGEGVVARAPNSLYAYGRTNSAIKFKAHKDQEALVVELINSSSASATSTNTTTSAKTRDGDGDSRQLTYVLKLNNDTTITAQFTPPTAAHADTSPSFPSPHSFSLSPSSLSSAIPLVGDVVTFSYTIVNSLGTPANATILRVRRELTWDDVLATSSREAALNTQTESALVKRTRKVAGYWTNDDNKNIRQFLDEYARAHAFDPLVPDNWAPVSTRDIIAAGGIGFIGNYKGSLVKCLVDVYPDIGFRITSRNKLPQRYWKERENRKQVLDNLAKRLKFDPLIQKNWYWITRPIINSEKGGSSMLDYYNGSIGNALKDIYPTVPWHEPNFFRKYWHEPLNRRKFFDSYARAMGFDPLVASNWYSITTESVLQHPGGHAVMEFHRSLHSALQELYPNLSLDDLKFKRMSFGYWNSATRRDFFDRFAKEHGFDPLAANNWYKYTTAHIHAVKGGHSALQSYGGSLIKALIDLYPDINPDSTLFSAVPARHWKDPANRKAMLVRVAKQRGLDPEDPKTWLAITAKQLAKISGGRYLLKEAKGLQNALAQSFPAMHKQFLQSRPGKAKASQTLPSIWDRITSKSSS